MKNMPKLLRRSGLMPIVLKLLLVTSILLGQLLPPFSIIQAENSLVVTVDNFGNMLEINVCSDDGNRTVQSIDVNIDSEGWMSLDPDDGSYGGDCEMAILDGTQIPSGTHSVLVRAIDDLGGEWPAGYVEESVTNSDFMSLEIDDDYLNEVVNILAHNDEGWLKVTGIQYRVDSGSWINLDSEDGSYGGDYETAVLPYLEVPTGTHTVDIRTFDQFDDFWPQPGGYSSITVDGTGETPIEDGTSPETAAPITSDPVSYNLSTNSDGTWVYFYFDAGANSDFAITTNNVSVETDTYMEYFGTDSTFTSLVSYNDDISGTNHFSEIVFAASQGTTYYFRVRHSSPPSSDSFGISYQPYSAPIGSTPANPAQITTTGNVYNLDTNSDGTWVYLYANILSPGDYLVETYQDNVSTDTYIEYYGTDSSFSTLVDSNDNGEENAPYSTIHASDLSTGYIYLRVRHVTSSSTDNFGIRFSADLPITRFATNTVQTGSAISAGIQVDGERPLLAAYIAYRSNDYSIDTITFNSEAFTKGCQTNRNEYQSEVWYLNEANITTDDVTVTFTGEVEDINFGVILVNEVSTTNPVTDNVCSNGWDNNPYLTISSSEDEIVFGGVGTYTGSENNISVDPATQQIWEINTGNVISMGSLEEGATSTTLDWALSVEWPWSAAAISINQEEIPGTSPSAAAPITLTGETYNFATNSDGTWVYTYLDTPSNGDYYVETYDVGDSTDTYLEFHSTDINYNNLTDISDNFDGSNYSRIYFSTASAQRLYFRVKHATSASVDDFGIRYATGLPTCDFLIFNETFEKGVGSTIDHDSTLYATIGSEWQVDVNPPNSQAKIQGDGYQANGLGAFTLESIANVGSENTLELDADLSSFTTSDPLKLSFNYLWIDSSINASDGFDVYIAETQSAEYHLIASIDNRDLIGSYHNLEIDLAANLNSNPDEYFRLQIRWRGQQANESSPENLSIDDFKIFLEQTGTCSSTNPGIVFTQEPTATEDTTIRISGTASSTDSSWISAINITYTIDGVTEPTFTIDTSDYSYDSTSELFDYSIITGSTGSYSISITAQTAAGGTITYPYNGTIADIDGPVLDIINLGSEPLNDNTPSYTGTVTDSQSPIVSVEYRVYAEGIYEIGWTSATADDGTFDETYETFHFDISPALTDGVKVVEVKATDTQGNVNKESSDTDGQLVDRIIINAVDETAPIIQLQEVIPNPTRDPEPFLQGKVRDNEDDLSSNITYLWYKIDDSETWNTLPTFDGTLSDEIEEFFSIRLEGLELGEHTITVRAEDAANNDTNDQGLNKQITFEIIEQEELESIQITKFEDFIDHSDQDRIGSNLIWGNSILRLAEVMDPSSELLVSDGFGPRYGYFARSFRVSESNTNGFWVSKLNKQFSYYNFDTDTETVFNLSDYVPWEANIAEIEEIYIDGQYHVWLSSHYGIVGINLGSTITNKADDTYASLLTGAVGTNLVEVDERDASYGVYFNSSLGIHYFSPGNFDTAIDDQNILYSSLDGYNIDNATALFLDDATNQLWVGDYDDGLSVINDSATPLNKTDDSSTTPSSQIQIFSIGKDRSGNIFVGGDDGLQVLVGGETITLASTSDLGLDVVAWVQYIPGTFPTQDQFFIAARNGNIYYLSTNGTYQDLLDDQIIELSTSQDVYPTDASSFFIKDEDTLIVVLDRLGVYQIDLNRDYVSSGVGLSEISASIEGRLDTDFITLEEVNILVDTGTITYEISNDGGITWLPIALGQTVNFPQKDYRIKFRITMQHGSTPVLDSIKFSYSAYPNPDERGMLLDIENEPVSVKSGESFSFDIKAFDDLLNPYEDETIVNLQLRKVSNHEVINDFNVNQADIENGLKTIENAKASVLGLHYIYAQTDEAYAISDVINFYEETSSPRPTLALTANKYQIQPAETVTLSWSSTNLTTLSLFDGERYTTLPTTSGTMQFSLDKTTTFTLYGSGNYGNLSTSITIQVIDQTIEEPQLPPEIIEFRFEELETKDTHKKVKLIWKVDNVEYVSIPGVGNNLPAIGYIEVYIYKEEKFELIATNEFGQDKAELTVLFDQSTKMSLDKEDSGNKYKNLLILAVALAVTALAYIFVAGSHLFKVLEHFGALIGILIPRKKKHWGVVYDLDRNKVLPFATVRLYKDNNLVSQTVSDLDGRYALLIDNAGEYILKCEAAGFKTYSDNIKISEVKNNVEILEDIAMERVDRKVTWLNRLRFYYKKELLNTIRVFFTIAMFIGFIYSIIVLTTSQSIYNIVVVLLYLLIFAANLISLAKYISPIKGRVLDEQGNPIANASVRFYQEGNQLGIFLTNKEGKIKVNLTSGDYWIILHKRGYKSTSFEARIIKKNEPKGGLVTFGTDGRLKSDLVLEKLVDKNKKDTTELVTISNPFE